MSVGYGVPWRSLHPKNHPISPSVVTTMGLLVLLLFQTSVDGIARPSNREKNTIFASQSEEKRIGDGFIKSTSKLPQNCT